MEQMIDSYLIKELRNGRSWTQDQLAAVAGLSLRTIQRIEKEGVCSLESRQALASVFEIDTCTLQLDSEGEVRDKHMRRVRLYSFLANTLGILCSFLGISYSLINGGLSGEEAGLYYAGVGLFGGLFYVGLALLCEYFRNNNVGCW